MNSFKDFNIKVSSTSFVGDKVKMMKVLNSEIIVHDFVIKDSERKPGKINFLLQRQSLRKIKCFNSLKP